MYNQFTLLCHMDTQEHTGHCNMLVKSPDIIFGITLYEGTVFQLYLQLNIDFNLQLNIS